MQFGAIDIDSELVALREQGPDDQQPEMIMLDNGCACCTVNENFVQILFGLVREALWFTTQASGSVSVAAVSRLCNDNGC